MKRLFSTDTDDGTITVIDASDAKLEVINKIRVGNGPRGGVKFTRDGRGFVANHAGDTISEIDAREMREVGRIRVGVAPIGVAIVPGDEFALVSIAGENSVAIVNLAKRARVHSVKVGREPRHPSVSPDGKHGYVPISGDDYVARIDLAPLARGGATIARMTESARLELGKGTTPYSFAISPDGRYGVAANNQASFVTIVELGVFRAAHRVEVGTKGARGATFTPDSRRAFVSIEDSNEIVVLDLESGSIEGRIATGPGPRGVLFDTDREVIYSAAFSRSSGLPIFLANTLTVLSATPEAIAALGEQQPEHREVRVGAGPCSVTMFAQ